MRLKDTCFLEEKLWQTYTKPAKKQKHHLANKGPYRQSYVFSIAFVDYSLWVIQPGILYDKYSAYKFKHGDDIQS